MSSILAGGAIDNFRKKVVVFFNKDKNPGRIIRSVPEINKQLFFTRRPILFEFSESFFVKDIANENQFILEDIKTRRLGFI